MDLVNSRTYPQRTVPMNDIPKFLQEPLLCSSSFFGLEIPLVSLKVPKFSGTTLGEDTKGVMGTYQRSKTGSPVLVHLLSWKASYAFE